MLPIDLLLKLVNFSHRSHWVISHPAR